MGTETKHKILRQLSQTRGEKAEAAIRKEFAKVKTGLENETTYYALKQYLAELAIYAVRMPVETYDLLESFCEKIDDAPFVELEHEYSFFDEATASERLATEAIGILERLRYFDLSRMLEILTNFSSFKNGAIQKRALEALKKSAKYDIDIFYSDEDRAGFGFAPQLKIVEFLEKHRAEVTSVDVIFVLSNEILSPSMDGTSWDYETVTWRKSTVPSDSTLEEIRTRTLSIIFDRYDLELIENDRRQIISAAFAATEFPRGGCSPELQSIIENNTLAVFDWIKSIIPNEAFPVLQKLEHDIYWRYYHGTSDAIRAMALDIRDILLDNAEYEIYRHLIGFESIFEDWETSLAKSRDFSKIEGERKVASEAYIKSISDENWVDWRHRILNFCQVRSNDMATFPLFYEFLEDLAVSHPEYALELVRDYRDKIEFFEIPLFRGLWKSPQREVLKQLALELATKGESLLAIARMFISNEEFDCNIVQRVLQTSIATKNEYILSELLLVAGTNYEIDPEFTVEKVFVPAVNALNDLRSANWVQNIWRQGDMRTLISHLKPEELSAFLYGIERTHSITYQVEEILKVIAEKNPSAVIEFFGRRLKAVETSSDFNAIPHGFQSLHGPLSEHSNLIVETVKSWNRNDATLFRFRGGRFIAQIFPEFGHGIEAELMALATSGNKLDANFVIGVVCNYYGEPFLHSVCRQLVITHYTDERLMEDVIHVLEKTGVVSGEYGMAEAYASKAKEISYWEDDAEYSVREFAKGYIETLTKQEEFERKRADESIELRKHQFGVRERN